MQILTQPSKAKSRFTNSSFGFKKGYIEIFRMPSTFANFFVHPWKASLWRGVINEGSGSRACVCTEAKRMLLWNPHNCSPSQQFSSPSQFDQHEPSWLNFIIFFSFQWKSSMKMNFPSSYSPVIKSQLLSPFWGPPLSDKAIKRSLKWINHESFSSEHDASSFLYRMLCAKISTKPKLSRAESHHQISSTSCMMFPTVSYFYWPHQMKLLGRFFFSSPSSEITQCEMAKRFFLSFSRSWKHRQTWKGKSLVIVGWIVINECASSEDVWCES